MTDFKRGNLSAIEDEIEAIERRHETRMLSLMTWKITDLERRIGNLWLAVGSLLLLDLALLVLFFAVVTR